MISIEACSNTLVPTSIRVGFDQANIDRFVEAKLSALLHSSIAGDRTVKQPALQLVVGEEVMTTATPTLHDDGTIIIADFELASFDGENLVVGLRRVRETWDVAATATICRLEIPGDNIVLASALLGSNRFAYRVG